MANRAALVLAGGKARRFQSGADNWEDKAVALLEGKPLLVHVIQGVNSVVDEVLVCVNDPERGYRYRRILEAYGIPNAKIVVDSVEVPMKGPNLAIMSGLKATQADQCVTVPCDMPYLNPKVAAYLLDQATDAEVTVPMWPNGNLETLLMALQRVPTLEITQTLLTLKRPRADDIPRAASKTHLISPLKEIRNLDPQLQSFININSKKELKTLPTRSIQGPATQDIQLTPGTPASDDLKRLRYAAQMMEECNFGVAKELFGACAADFEGRGRFFWAGVAEEQRGEALSKMQIEGKNLKVEAAFFAASKIYRQEAKLYSDCGVSHLEGRALADKVWCDTWTQGKTGQIRRWTHKSEN
ncbi:MAG: molybdenum cofactor guanylyltransferase [Candidatus Bathyarchaeota archaeon]|nr:molybdenum cofactor guanylyltransferase [Candidatus Bathyarchaeota archaeon]